MKQLFTLLAFICISSVASAQRFAYMDSEYILNKMPEYKKAQESLDKIAGEWQKEIEDKMKEIENMYQKFQAEQPLLTDKMKQERITSIESKERELKELQKAKFSPNGELFKKRQELIQPIQDRIYDEIQKIAKIKSYDVVFDKSSGASMIYTNPKLNISDEIVKAMGGQ
ncbi:MAG: OmpH family outer membrane protein [Chitinophagales bacterium]|nr:OmpH family outer membrane protein [Chitinophagales bacterium]